MPRGKAHRRKKRRTHVKEDPERAQAPKSFVIKMGEVGNPVEALVHDLRRVMEPNTSTRLKERKSNRLRDFVTMAGPLGVTHMMAFSQPSVDEAVNEDLLDKYQSLDKKPSLRTTTTLNFRIFRLPRGPTLSFKVLRYSLASDIANVSRHPRGIGREYSTPPVLLLSGFNTTQDKHVQLTAAVFKSMFPTLKVQSMSLNNVRRIVLLRYDPVTHSLDFRHYLVRVRHVGVSKSIRKAINGSVTNSSKKSSGAPLVSDLESSASEPESNSEEDNEGSHDHEPKARLAKDNSGRGVVDLQRTKDISDFVLKYDNLGYESSDSDFSDASDNEQASSDDDGILASKKPSSKVTLPGDYMGRGNKSARGEQRAVRLEEIGPRMELGLFKIDEGISEGDVLFHELIHKTKAQAQELKKRHDERRRLAAERRREQEHNVEAKKQAKDENRRLARKAQGLPSESENEDDDRSGNEENDQSDHENSEGTEDSDLNPGMPPDSGEGENDDDFQDESDVDEVNVTDEDQDHFDNESSQEEQSQEDEDSDLSPIEIDGLESFSEESEAEPPSKQKLSKHTRKSKGKSNKRKYRS